MGTQGTYGFKKNNHIKIGESPEDSSIDSLGKDIVKFISETSLDELNNIYDEIVVVDMFRKPSAKDISLYVNTDYTAYGRGYWVKGSTWQDLLRCSQGDLNCLKKDVKHLLYYANGDFECTVNNENKNIPYSHNEWEYIIDLDNQILKIFWRSEINFSKNSKISSYLNNSTDIILVSENIIYMRLNFDNIENEFLELSKKWDELYEMYEEVVEEM